ncbi:MAG: hypothetical protein ACFFDX_08355 [Candidatus Odinarchaeota archaeon]
MEFIDNLKKLGLKENRKYLILVIWLLIDITLIQIPIQIKIQIGAIEVELWDLIGVVIFLPFLTFLMFLFLLSMFFKKDIKEVSSWKIIIIFLVTLPLMFFISVILVAIFAFSVFSYIFFSSWFILYGAYLISRNVDERLKRHNFRKITRSLTFFGGVIFSLFLLVIMFVPALGILDIIYTFIPELSTYPIIILGVRIFFIIVGLIIAAFAFLTLVGLTRKSFNAWIGIFAILVVIYTYFLVVKVFIAVQSVGGGGSSTLITQILMIIIDIFIILYSISTLMGSQAELLSKRVFQKSTRISLDTILLWLVFSKVAYEFVHYFPYDWLQGLPYIDFMAILNESTVNLLRNIGIIIFFVGVLVILGLYEIRKYNINEKKFMVDIDKQIRETLSLKEELEYFTELSEKKFREIDQEEETSREQTVKDQNFEKDFS